MTSVDPNRAVRQMTSAIASGDPEAFSRFYDEWFDRAFAEARRCTGRDEHFCLDLVQEFMMRVIRSMKAMPSEAALFKWMRVVIRSCAYDRVRSDLRRARREHAPRPGVEHDRGEPDEQLAWLHDQINQLDDHDVRLLVMRHRFGWTLSQIGQALGLKHGAVDRRLRRIIALLRKRAKEDFNELSTW